MLKNINFKYYFVKVRKNLAKMYPGKIKNDIGALPAHGLLNRT